ncbi:hypothetical protein BDF19DRAFT_456630 [Syncephalis fuscata]|nr:hypothetical protein BDF19DRAFT_456630 [Syncephalis fuscata]
MLKRQLFYIVAGYLFLSVSKNDVVNADDDNFEVDRNGIGYAPEGELGVLSQPKLKIKQWQRCTIDKSFAIVKWNKKNAFLKCLKTSKVSNNELSVLERIESVEASKGKSKAGKDNIQRKWSSFDVPGGICMVFPFIEGKTLIDFFDNKSWEIKTAHLLPILIQGLQGLSYLHSMGILHNDMWVENIIITMSKVKRVKVTIIDYDQSKLFAPATLNDRVNYKKQLNFIKHEANHFFTMLYSCVMRLQFEQSHFYVMQEYVKAAGPLLRKANIKGFKDWITPSFPLLNKPDEQQSLILPDPSNLKIARGLVPFFIVMLANRSLDVSKLTNPQIILKYLTRYEETWFSHIYSTVQDNWHK